MSQEIEVLPSEVLVTPVGSFADTAKAMEQYQLLCQRLLDANDWQDIRGKKFPKRSAWRKLSVAYGVSYTIIDRKMRYDDNDNLLSAEFVIRATAPNGRHADGWGSCATSERNAGHKANHDIPATAETRAKNRAAADLFGMGQVSAEEVNINAMYANEQALSTLDKRLHSLTDAMSDDLKAWWVEKGYPKYPYLTDDQVDDINSKIDELVEEYYSVPEGEEEDAF